VIPAAAIFEGFISCLTAGKAFHFRHLLSSGARQILCGRTHQVVVTAVCNSIDSELQQETVNVLCTSFGVE